MTTRRRCGNAVTAVKDFGLHLATFVETTHGSATIGEGRCNTLLRTTAGSRFDAAGIHALGQRKSGCCAAESPRRAPLSRSWPGKH